MALTFFISMLISMAGCFAAPSSIREVDFKNSSHPWGGHPTDVPSTWKWLSTIPTGSVRLVNGRHNFDKGGYLVLAGTTYGDLNGDKQDEAVVDLRYGTGGTATWHFLYVYTLEGNQPKLIAMMECGSRAFGGLEAVKIEKSLLVLDFADSELRQGDCCSGGFVRVQYRWHGNRFRETGSRTKGALIKN